MKNSLIATNDYSPFSCLPDEIIFQIFIKIIDFKTICFCKLVSKQFSSIVHQLDAISFIVPPSNSDSDTLVADACLRRHSFRSAILSLEKFTLLKSLNIQLPSSPPNFIIDIDDIVLFKWKAKFSIDKLDSLVFLVPNSIYSITNNTNSYGTIQENEERWLTFQKLDIAYYCLLDAVLRFDMLLGFIKGFPFLENVYIKDSEKKGTVSLSGGQIVEFRKWLISSHESIERKLKHSKDIPGSVSVCYIPLLELPVSRYVMKGVTLILMMRDDLADNEDYSFIKDSDFEDNDEAGAYTEAVMEIYNKHRGSIEMMH